METVIRNFLIAALISATVILILNVFLGSDILGRNLIIGLSTLQLLFVFGGIGVLFVLSAEAELTPQAKPAAPAGKPEGQAPPPPPDNAAATKERDAREAQMKAEIARLTAELEALKAQPPKETVVEKERVVEKESRVLAPNAIVISRKEFEKFMTEEHALAVERRAQSVFDILTGIHASAGETKGDPIVLDSEKIVAIFTQQKAPAEFMQELRSILGRMKAHANMSG